MNLKDEEWQPCPSDPAQLRSIRALTNACVSTHDLASLRAALLAAPYHGAIPHELRGAVWLLLLRLRAEALLAEDASAFAQHARESVGDSNSREQIEKDVDRTRPGLARFKQPAVRGALLRLLSLFCQRRGVAYVQGFNELLAPFVLLADTGGNPRIVYALFNEFTSRFAPWMLETSETKVFDVLKRMFKYFGRLLLYHDPELYWLLERHMMTPDLYATSWFVTLFARNFTVESVVALWDLLLLEDNPLGTLFFGVALLCSKRDELLSVDESRIPETLMMLTAKSPEDVRALWRIGSTMRVVHTPPSFQLLMTDRLLRASGKEARVSLPAARAMQASACLQTTPEDLIAGEAHYFTWDCRTLDEYNAGHLAQAAYLPLDALREANGKITSETSEAARKELQAAMDLCEPLKDSSHICLVGSGVREEDKTDVNMLALYLTRIGVKYVSTLRGGFQEAIATAHSEDTLTRVELVDYDRRKFERARKRRLSAQSKRNQLVERTAAAGRRAGVTSGATSDEVQREESPLSSFGKATAKDSLHTSRPPSSENADVNESTPTISSFLEKTDAEVSRALNRALTGMGIRLSALGSGSSGDRENSQNEQTPGSATSTAESFNPFSPNSVVSDTIDANNADLPSAGNGELTTGNIGGPWARQRAAPPSPEPPKIRRSLSSMNNAADTWTEKARQNGASRGSAMSVENSPRYMDTPSNTMSPRPGVQVDLRDASSESPIRQKPKSSAGGFFGVQKSPWGRDAKPGWLEDETLSFPLQSMPKGFTVNVMDDRVMAGLRLFPCKARSDRSMGLRGRSSEFKKRYVGVSSNYLLLLSPYNHRTHLLEVKLIRYLQDISRITFKRNRPDLVTFEVLTYAESASTPEHIVCLMPDGLKQCVALIKDYLAERGVMNEAETNATSVEVGKEIDDSEQSRTTGSDIDGIGSGGKRSTEGAENIIDRRNQLEEPVVHSSETDLENGGAKRSQSRTEKSVHAPSPAVGISSSRTEGGLSTESVGSPTAETPSIATDSDSAEFGDFQAAGSEP